MLDTEDKQKDEQRTKVSRGKKTFYPFKTLKPVTTNFTELSREAIAKYQAKGPSCSDIQEHALRKLAGLPVNEDLEKLIESINAEPVAS